jgi:hypothetical protein
MSTLHVYGDSFVADENDDQTGWPYILAKSVGLDVTNHGVSGSSTEYAFCKFMHDVEKRRFSDGDVIIFVVSSPLRLHFTEVLEKYPQYGSRYINITAKELNDPSNQWLKDNKEYLDWWYVKTDLKLNEYNHEAYIHMIKTWADAHPKNTVLVLHNLNPKNFIEISNSKNFFIPQFSLGDVSDKEHGCKGGHAEFVEKTTYDPRINHLTIPNAEILADALVTTLKNKSTKSWGSVTFRTDLISKIKNHKDYLKAVGLGVIPKRQWIIDQLK